jgi:hypothetical protein
MVRLPSAIIGLMKDPFSSPVSARSSKLCRVSFMPTFLPPPSLAIWRFWDFSAAHVRFSAAGRFFSLWAVG